jgi:hypothetical protein
MIVRVLLTIFRVSARLSRRRSNARRRERIPTPSSACSKRQCILVAPNAPLNRSIAKNASDSQQHDRTRMA